MERVPYHISYNTFRKIALQTAKYTADKLPDYYPTVEDVDELIESREFNFEEAFREDTFVYFILCLSYGFTRDELWHSRFPRKRTLTGDNVAAYLLTPYDGKDSLLPHVGIWQDGIPLQEQENRQSVFEYIQSIIIDPDLFRITKEEAND